MEWRDLAQIDVEMYLFGRIAAGLCAFATSDVDSGEGPRSVQPTARLGKSIQVERLLRRYLRGSSAALCVFS